MSRPRVFLAILLASFLVIRLLGVGLPYHQDEWKTVDGVIRGATGASGLYHPPLTQLLFRAGGWVFGSDYLRLLPLLFAVASAVLLFAVIRHRVGSGAAFGALTFYSFSFYSVWASLQIDTDGAILPAIFLLTILVYDQAMAATGRAKIGWWLITALAILLGWLVKLSFVLVVGTIFFDFAFSEWRAGRRRRVLISICVVIGLSVLFVLSLLGIKSVYPAFQIGGMIAHAKSFVNFGGREYLQILVQLLKAIMYLSPLFLCPLAWLDRQTIRPLRLFFISLLLGGLFYLVLFDFSRGALDKYLAFSIVPLAAISGVVIARYWKWSWPSLAAGGLIAVWLLTLNFFPHAVLPLYPKTQWFADIAAGRWNRLVPFTGGSGPLGFYISFLFIAVCFIVSFLLGVMGKVRLVWRPVVAVVLVIVGLVYNSVFIEELLAGQINGSSRKVLTAAISQIAADRSIKGVITYSDIGAYELSRLGKYNGRFYTAPQFESFHQRFFAEQRKLSDFLVVDLPRLNPDSFYGKFLSSCAVIFGATSRQVSAKIYRC